MDHVRMHGSLFTPEFVSQIVSSLEVSETDLSRINRMSEKETTVHQWLRTNLASEDAKVANDAYVLAALVRGKLNEYLARQNGFHIRSHEFRRPIEISLRPGRAWSVSNSEEYFVKIIVGSALLETSADRRVATWVDNIVKSQNAIEGKGISLPNARADSDAERCAADGARVLGIRTTYARIRRELEVASALAVSSLLTFCISPWAAPAGPAITVGYRHWRGSTIGEDVAKLLDTRARFRRLARSVPGRIGRSVASPGSGEV
jgi:hypothetical protein